MQYSANLARIPLQVYGTQLKGQTLLPSRQILHQDIVPHFAALHAAGITNVAQLRESLSTPIKVIQLAAQTGIPEAYLLMLKREIGNLTQKPVALASFPGLSAELLRQLSTAGIKTSKDYWESKPQPGMLSCLCDLVRINGVGPIAAVAFYEAGLRSVADVAAADAVDMLARVSAVNEAKQYYKAKLGVGDMQFCIDFANLLLTYTV